MNAVDKRVTQAPTLHARGARFPLSGAFPHRPGDVFASDSETGSECIASKNFRSPSIVARCLDASMSHGLRDGDPCNAVCFHSTVGNADLLFVFPQRPHTVLRKKLEIGMQSP